ncbi:MAG: hypothetical protein ACI4E1_02410 [Lachnospira sp.]
MDNQESSDYISMSQKPYRRVVTPRKIEMDVPEVICKPYIFPLRIFYKPLIIVILLTGAILFRIIPLRYALPLKVSMAIEDTFFISLLLLIVFYVCEKKITPYKQKQLMEEAKVSPEYIRQFNAAQKQAEKLQEEENERARIEQLKLDEEYEAAMKRYNGLL